MILKPRPFRKPRKGHWSTTNLIGYWPLYEGGGDTVLDLSGNGNIGTFQGTAPSWTPGKFGSAVLLPGTDEYIDIGNKFNLGTADFTVIIWINQIAVTEFDAAISKGSFNGAGDFLIYDLTGTGSHYMTWRNWHNTGVEYINFGATSLVGTGWRQLALTRNGTTLTGHLDAIVSDTGELEANYDFTNTHKWIFGAREDGSAKFFEGQIDHVLIYNRALSSSEITQLYREPFCMFERDPIELWSAATLAEIPTGFAYSQAIIIS